MRSIRLTVTIPMFEFEQIERAKKRRGLNRSALLKEIIDFFFKREVEKTNIERYVDGYKRKPENPAEIARLEKVQADTFGEFK